MNNRWKAHNDFIFISVVIILKIIEQFLGTIPLPQLKLLTRPEILRTFQYHKIIKKLKQVL